ncbi:hypothetical protein ES705_42833 [subsurface metagenome]
MSKLVKTTRSFTFYRVVPPTTTLETKDFDKIMRDILPDKPYNIHYIDITLKSLTEVGDTVRIGIGKNTSGALAPLVGEQLMVKSGLLYYADTYKISATKIPESNKFFFNPQQAITFDKDDGLNVQLSYSNTHATDPGTVFIYFNIGYSYK